MTDFSGDSMPSRAYVAHDRAVSAARMYIQMAVVGFVLASTIYVGAMSEFISRYLAAPIPELLFVGGKPRVISTAKSRRLRGRITDCLLETCLPGISAISRLVATRLRRRSTRVRLSG